MACPRQRRPAPRWTGAYSGDLLASGATHLIGGYWRVWPAVFHANLRLYERGEDRQVWGLTLRGAAARPLGHLRDWRQARIARLASDPELEAYRRAYGIPPLHLEGRVGEVDVYSVVPPGAPRLARAGKGSASLPAHE